MKNHYTLLLVLAFLVPISVLAQNDLEVTVLQPTGTPTTVGTFEKVELGLQLTATIDADVQKYFNGEKGLNPFNPNHIDVEAVLTGPSGVTRIVHGFYYRDFKINDEVWEEVPTDHHWRVRFALNQPGAWEVNVRVTAKGHPVLKTKTVKVIGENRGNNGYVIKGKAGNNTDRYLRFSGSNKTFFAVGENLAWVSEFKLKPNDLGTFTQWMKELSDNGGNFFRLGMVPWGMGIEWEKLGDYNNRMPHAWQLDQVVNQAEDMGLYMNFVIDWHDIFTPGWPSDWAKNPYLLGIDGVKEPIDFFRNTTAHDFYQRRLRYVVARWGYSTSLGVIELLNEMDHAVHGYNDGGVNTQIANKWFKTMSAYLKTELGMQERPVGVSLAGKTRKMIDKKVFPYADISLLHDYGDQSQQNYEKRYIKIRKLLGDKSTYNHPIVYNEVGAGIFPTLDYCSDITLHNAIWSTAMMGCFGTGMNWWWENAVHPQGYYTNYKAVNAFMKDEQLSQHPYNAQEWSGKGYSKYDQANFETFSLVRDDKERAIGWAHNVSYFWGNMGEINSCLQQVIRGKNGKHVDAKDNTDYTKNIKVGKVKPLSGEIFKLKGLHGGFFSKHKYKITWHATRGDGGHLSQYDEVKKTNCWGTAKFTVPPTNDQHPDYGFKVEKIK